MSNSVPVLRQKENRMPEFLPKLKDNKMLRKDGRFSKVVISLFVPSTHTPFLKLP